jgi:hypothetical protein
MVRRYEIVTLLRARSVPERYIHDALRHELGLSDEEADDALRESGTPVTADA